MYTKEQATIIRRIWNNFYVISGERGMPDSDASDEYRKDIALLCSEEVFTPEVLNFAMDLLQEIAKWRECDDSANLISLQQDAFKNFRIGPSRNG